MSLRWCRDGALCGKNEHLACRDRPLSKKYAFPAKVLQQRTARISPWSDSTHFSVRRYSGTLIHITHKIERDITVPMQLITMEMDDVVDLINDPFDPYYRSRKVKETDAEKEKKEKEKDKEKAEKERKKAEEERAEEKEKEQKKAEKEKEKAMENRVAGGGGGGGGKGKALASADSSGGLPGYSVAIIVVAAVAAIAALYVYKWKKDEKDGKPNAVGVWFKGKKETMAAKKEAWNKKREAKKKEKAAAAGASKAKKSKPDNSERV